ncbi:MAG: GHKL domain-containing protein, partial [Clostridia bacterium]|nr:GHKL domain-containing protein [Clostridia bacterium]
TKYRVSGGRRLAAGKNSVRRTELYFGFIPWKPAPPPPDLPVEDMDLCVIVSNALDNAIQACLKVKHCQPDIEITIKVRHQFLLVEVTNTTLSMDGPEPGTGLKNIFSAAEKYQGTTEIGTDNGRFRISVLLCLETDRLPDTKRKQPFT